jgi:hypothetical protein
MPILFYYWRVDAGSGAAAVARRRIVNEVVAPIFVDPVIHADADCIFARKYTSNPPPRVTQLEPLDEVRLIFASTPEAQPGIVARVASRFPPNIRARIADDPDTTRACGNDCSWYRHRLKNVTAIALDLHRSAEFDAHQQFFRGVHSRGGLRAFSRPALHDYLCLNSLHYAALDERSLVDFWDEFLRWGPEPSLFPPGHVLENLMLVE